jgi:hypothetical protein
VVCPKIRHPRGRWNQVLNWSSISPTGRPDKQKGGHPVTRGTLEIAKPPKTGGRNDRRSAEYSKEAVLASTRLGARQRLQGQQDHGLPPRHVLRGPSRLPGGRCLRPRGTQVWTAQPAPQPRPRRRREAHPGLLAAVPQRRGLSEWPTSCATRTSARRGWLPSRLAPP